jgi:hypothetical protein
MLSLLGGAKRIAAARDFEQTVRRRGVERQYGRICEPVFNIALSMPPLSGLPVIQHNCRNQPILHSHNHSVMSLMGIIYTNYPKPWL